MEELESSGRPQAFSVTSTDGGPLLARIERVEVRAVARGRLPAVRKLRATKDTQTNVIVSPSVEIARMMTRH